MARADRSEAQRPRRRSRPAAEVDAEVANPTAAPPSAATALAQAQLGNQVVAAALSGTEGSFGDTVAADLGAEICGLSPTLGGSNSEMGQLLDSAPLQRDARHTSVGPDEAQIASLIRRSRGQPLPSGVLGRMGAALGHDFSGVVVHTDASAQHASELLNANAFALGRHVFFRPGAFAPGTAEGDELLAHELAHVQQHDEGRLPSAPGMQVSVPTDTAETEAVRVAQRAMPALHDAPAPELGQLSGLPTPLSDTPALDTPAMGLVGVQPVPSAAQALGPGPIMRGVLDWAAEKAGQGASWVGDQIAEQFGGSIMAAIRSVSPALADLIEGGIGGVVTDVLSDGVQAFAETVFGDLDPGAQMQSVFDELQGIFAVFQGVLGGDPACCETFDQWLAALTETISGLADHPVVAVLLEGLEVTAGVVGDLLSLFTRASLEGFLEMFGAAKGAWDAAMAVYDGAMSALSAMGDWVWSGVCELLGISNDEAADLSSGLMEQGQTWFAEMWEGISGGVVEGVTALKQVIVDFSGLGLLMDLFDLLKQTYEGATFLYDNWGSPTLVEDAAGVSPVLGAFADGLTTASDKATELGGWAAEFFPEALDQVNGSLESMGMGWLADGMRLIATPLLLPLQLGVDFATWFGEGGQQTMVDWAQEVWDYTKPVTEVFTTIVTAIAFPPAIPLLFAGWAWQALPECLKPPIVDFLLDLVITALQALESLPGLGPLFAISKAALVPLLMEIKGRSDEEKILITDKVAKILSGSPDFVLGFVVGFGKGILDGILDPLMLIWLAIQGVKWVVEHLLEILEAGAQAMQGETEQAAQDVEQQADDLSDVAVTLGPVDLAALEQQAEEAGEGATDPLADPAVAEAVRTHGSEVVPAADAIGEDLEPGITSAFGGEGGGVTVDGIIAAVGGAWEAMLSKIEEASAWVGRKIIELMLSDNAEYDIGHGAGYVAGFVAFEVLLAFLTAGAWASLGPTARAIVRFLDLGGEAIGGAFKLFAKFGDDLLAAVQPLLRLLDGAGVVGRLARSFENMATSLIRMSDSVGGSVLAKGDEVAGAGARTTARAADTSSDGLGAVRRVVMAGDDVKLAAAARRIPPQPGVFDVVVHSDGGRLLVLQDGAWRQLSPAELAEQMRSAGYRGGEVRLIACGSGNADGVAARLADEVGAPVTAPTDTAWIHVDGSITVGPRADVPSGSWSRSTPAAGTEVVEGSSRLTDEALAGADEAVSAAKRSADDMRYDGLRRGTGSVRGVDELSDADVAMVLNRQLDHLSPSQIDEIISRYPAAEQQMARALLSRSSGFGSVEALGDVYRQVQKLGGPVYMPGRGSLGDNLFYMSKKELFGGPKLRRTDQLVDDAVVIVDDVVLNRIATDPGFAQRLVQHNCTLIHPRGFTDGVNMFRATTPAAVGDKLDELMAGARGMSGTPDEIAEQLLDQRLLDQLDQLDPPVRDALLKQLTRTDPASTAARDSDTIARQLNGNAGITEAEITQVLGRLPERYRPLAREMLVQQSEILSTRGFGKALGEQHRRLQAMVGNRPVYYYIPESEKSYGLMSMAHRDLTGTPVSRYIDGPNDLSGRQLEPDAVVVIFDDVAASGDSLEWAFKDMGTNNDVIVSPMLSTDDARRLFSDPNDLGNKPNLSFEPQNSVSSLKDSDFYKGLSSAERADLEGMLGHLGFPDPHRDGNALSMAFPYMAPDNNNAFFADLVAPYFITGRSSKASKNIYGDWTPPQP